MDGLRTLLEEYWIRRDADRELYYRMKRELPKFQKFVREQLGWRLLQNEHMLKLEKIPAHAESFMGILDFTDVRDYCILCAVLMYLEDREEQEQFLLSELIHFVEAALAKVMEVDWNSFSQRKSLVRVLRFAEGKGMLRVYEGNSDAFGQNAGQEVLYENTGLSRYFATNFSYDISGCTGWRDFEKEPEEANAALLRINRVYRQLTVCPAMYWAGNEDMDSLYLKNQRSWVAKNLEEYLGGRLDIHKNAAFLMLEETDSLGMTHPRESMLSELTLLFCACLREQVAKGRLRREPDESVCMEREEFAALLLACRERWQEAFSKEYREMAAERLLEQVLSYMELWMMARQEDRMVRIYPAAGKTTGFYPRDYKGAKENDE